MKRTGKSKVGNKGNEKQKFSEKKKKEVFSQKKRSFKEKENFRKQFDREIEEKNTSRREIKKKEPELTRLNKYISNAGICSRREADTYIKAGVVTVNGEVITEMGYKVNPGDQVKFNEESIKSERKVYVLLNKPKDIVTSASDPQGRRTVIDLVKDTYKERIYPVGRLDRNTTGVLLLTNDGDMAKQLTHPRYNKKKIYQVILHKKVLKEHIEQISKGIELEDGPIAADAISYVDPADKTIIGIEIHSGRNRIVRRIFEHFGYKVNKLDRVYFAGLTKKGLIRGKHRKLTEKEIIMLKTGRYV